MTYSPSSQREWRRGIHWFPTFFRHALAALVVLAVAIGLNVYLQPFSLHRIVLASGEQFDQVPDADGIVRIEGSEIDFRLPRLTLSSERQSRVKAQLGDGPSSSSDFDTAVRIVRLERTQLNGVDAKLPGVDECSAERILSGGHDRYSLCSAYARLFVELAQLMGLQARVLWLEGHVAAEYFDRQAGAWVYIDPQLGVTVEDDSKRRLSVAQTIARLQRGESIEFQVIDGTGERAIDFAEFRQRKPHWYRNILLNGETRAYSGATLVEPGRWHVLAKHRVRPAVLVLATPFDPSVRQRVERLSAKKVIATFVGMWLSSYGFLLMIRGSRGAVRSQSLPQRTETFPGAEG